MGAGDPQGIKLGLFGFVFSGGAGAVFVRKPLRQRGLRWFWGFRDWVCFAQKGAICRGVSTSVERGCWPLRHEGTREFGGFGRFKVMMIEASMNKG